MTGFLRDAIHSTTNNAPRRKGDDDMQTTTTTTTTIYYIATGSVRGPCGHRHRTVEGAQRCADHDGEGCASQGGYSDRVVRREDGSPLTAAERGEPDERALRAYLAAQFSR